MFTSILLAIGSCLIGYALGWQVGLGVLLCVYALAWNIKENMIVTTNLIIRNR